MYCVKRQKRFLTQNVAFFDDDDDRMSRNRCGRFILASNAPHSSTLSFAIDLIHTLISFMHNIHLSWHHVHSIS